MKVRVLIGGALGDVPHEPGDILEVAPRQGQRWIDAGIAEKVSQVADDEGDD